MFVIKMLQLAVIFMLSYSMFAGGATTRKEPSFTLRILHTNDMHSRFEQTSKLYGRCSEKEAALNKCYGGYARTLAAVKQQKAKAASQGIPLLFLNAGDTYQGTTWYTVYKWQVAARFTNLMDFHAMSLGNHELDDGIEGLIPFINNVTSPIVTCNLNLAKEPSLAATKLKNSTILEVNGKQYGIIGYLTPETKILAKTGLIEFEDEITRIAEEVKLLKSKGVEIMIAVGHSGFTRDLEIAKAVPDLDVVVGGHSHTFLYTGEVPDSEIPASLYPTIVKQNNGRKVAVVQAFAFTKYLGILNVDFDENGEVLDASGDPILLNSDIPEDPDMLVELDKWRQGVNNATKEVIGKTKVFLDGRCRFTECNMANMMTDAFQYYAVKNYASSGWSIAPIVLINGGSVRSSINATLSDGQLTREDIMTAMPFYNSLNILSLEGKYLLEALEWSVARYDPLLQFGKGEFLQVAGLRVVYNISAPVKSRVAEVEVLCRECGIPVYQPIEPNMNYTLVVPSFVSDGGDNFTMIKEHGVILYTADLSDTDQVMNFIQDRKIIYHGLDDRITFVHTSKKNKSSTLHQSSLIITIICLFLFIFR